MSIITIYDKSSTNFTNLGLGTLLPFQCNITEELNGMYELELIHNYDSLKKYNLLENERIILANTPNGRQPFRIYRVVPTMESITVNARHIFYDLLDNYITSLSISGSANEVLKSIINRFVYSTNFKFETNIKKSGSIILDKESPISAFLNADNDKSKFIQSFGGEILRDNFNIKILENIGEDKGYTIRYGKNLLGLTVDEDYSNVVTRVYAYGKDNINVVVDSENINNYLYPKIVSQDFGDIGDTSTLLTRARDFLKTSDKPTVNIDVNFVLLSKTEEYKEFQFLEDIKLGDILTIYNQKMNFSKKAKVISYVYDAISDSYINVVLGDFLNILTDSIISNNNSLKVVSGTSNNALANSDIALQKVNQLEANKQSVIDETLLTKDKSIVGAINEIFNKIKK
ncbi:MAG: phage tail spike protein [Lachnospirales bacterium]